VIHGEFDVQIDFSLSDGFHSASSAVVSLSVGYEADHHTVMKTFPGRYESREEDWQDFGKRIRGPCQLRDERHGNPQTSRRGFACP
jgi:hypothetical protein